MTINPHTGSFPPFVIRLLDTAGHMANPQTQPASMPVYSFLYLISGEMVVEAGEESLPVRSHTFLIIPPGTFFSVRYHADCMGYMGGFSPSFLKDSGHMVLHLKTPTRLILPIEDYLLLDELMTRLFRQSRQHSFVRSLLDMILGYMDTILPELSYRRNRICSGFLDAVFDRDKPMMTVSGYASLLGVSPNHLGKVVRALTGRTAGEWVDISRIALARILLRRTELPISEVAFKVGLDDPAYFARFFKKKVGMSPSQFREYPAV